MISRVQALRTYIEMQGLFEGTADEYVSKAIVQPLSHPLSKAFQDMSSTHRQYFEKRFSGYKRYPLLSKVAVDGVEVFKSISDKFSLSIEKLESLATPAPFGRGAETVFDPSVRLAMEVAASRIETEFSSEMKGYIDEELKKFAPNGCKLVPKLYKLHAYGEGGHFDKHRDTAHAANHYATMIINLPSTYTGGEFKLQVNDEEVVLESISKPSSPYRVGIAVFLTDLVHQVMPVTSGTRVVLQYDVYLEQNATLDSDKMESDQNSDTSSDDEMRDGDIHSFRNKKKPWDRWASYYESNGPTDLLQSQHAAQARVQGGIAHLATELDKFIAEHPEDRLCFVLNHSYPMVSDIDVLKDGDRVLHETLTSLGFEVSLGFVRNKFVSGYDDSYSLEAVKQLEVTNYEDLAALFESITIGTENVAMPKRKTHCIFGKCSSFTACVSEPYIDHTGNECAVARFVYVTSVLSLGPRTQVGRTN